MTDEVPLDDLDRALIVHLQHDGRATYDELGEVIGVSAEEARTRAKDLFARGVLDVVAVTDPLQLGYARQAILGVEVEGSPQDVIAALQHVDEAIYVVEIDDPINVMVEVVGASDARLLELVAMVRRLTGVRRIHTFLVTQVVKESYTYGTS